jgi:hypothetical protein
LRMLHKAIAKETRACQTHRAATLISSRSSR